VTRNLALTLFIIEILLLDARFPFGLKLDKSTPLQSASVHPEQLGGDAIVPVTDDRRQLNSGNADEPYRHQQMELT
jgi:hypothetical protein